MSARATLLTPDDLSTADRDGFVLYSEYLVEGLMARGIAVETIPVQGPDGRGAQVRRLAGYLTGTSRLAARRITTTRRASVAASSSPHIINGLRSYALMRQSGLTGTLRDTVYVAHNIESVGQASSAKFLPVPYRHVARLESRLQGTLEAEAWKSARLVVTPSNSDAKAIASKGASTAFVPWLPARQAERATYELDGTPFRVGFLGSVMWPPKRFNLLWLINDILPAVRASIPHLELHIAGSGTDSLDLTGRHGVILRGRVQNASNFLNSMDALVIVERQQSGLKLKAMDAAAQGLPIVSTSAGVSGSPLRGGRDCLVADTPTEFAAALSALAGSETARREFGTAARAALESERRHVEARFTSVAEILRKLQ